MRHKVYNINLVLVVSTPQYNARVVTQPTNCVNDLLFNSSKKGLQLKHSINNFIHESIYSSNDTYNDAKCP